MSGADRPRRRPAAPPSPQAPPPLAWHSGPARRRPGARWRPARRPGAVARASGASRSDSPRKVRECSRELTSPRPTLDTPMSTPAKMPQRPQLKVAQALAPPHNIEAEQSVLGAILLSDRTMYSLVIEEALRPEDFYRDRHSLIYGAILELYEQSEPTDLLTVSKQLRRTGKIEDACGSEAVDVLAS